ncbi:MAG: hypothetical protein RL758_160 [Pseudomonadota bacterium]|jgi:hypothetical protein
MTTPHKHADLIKKWADDPSQKVWHWFAGEWTQCPSIPLWYETNCYAIGEKPTSPPAKMCVLAGVEFPMPMTEVPKRGDVYWTIHPLSSDRTASFTWDEDQSDYRMLEGMTAFATRGGAEAYARALIAATKQAMEAAK